MRNAPLDANFGGVFQEALIRLSQGLPAHHAPPSVL